MIADHGLYFWKRNFSDYTRLPRLYLTQGCRPVFLSLEFAFVSGIEKPTCRLTFSHGLVRVSERNVSKSQQIAPMRLERYHKFSDANLLCLLGFYLIPCKHEA
jgi:hypothetical protein